MVGQMNEGSFSNVVRKTLSLWTKPEPLTPLRPRSMRLYSGERVVSVVPPIDESDEATQAALIPLAMALAERFPLGGRVAQIPFVDYQRKKMVEGVRFVCDLDELLGEPYEETVCLNLLERQRLDGQGVSLSLFVALSLLLQHGHTLPKGTQIRLLFDGFVKVDPSDPSRVLWRDAVLLDFSVGEEGPFVGFSVYSSP